MGFSLGGSSADKYRKQAQAKFDQAEKLANVQADIDFQRSLLSNIRQERMARAQLDLINYSDSHVSSSAINARSSLYSGLANATTYSLQTSERQEEIYDLQTEGQKLYEKYQKKKAKSSGTLSSIGSIAGAVVGGMVGGPLGASVGMSLGGAAGSYLGGGDSDKALNQVIQGAATYYTGKQQQDFNNEMLNMYKTYINKAYPTSGSQYTAPTIDSETGAINLLSLIGGYKQ